MKKNNLILMLFLLSAASVWSGCQTGAQTPEKTSANTNRTTAIPAPAAPTATPEMSEMRDPSNLEPKTSEIVKPTTSSGVTKANFEKIKEGMTLDDVEKLLGDDGLKVATNKINGKETEIYKWTEDNFASYIDVTFEKNKVIEKKEKGLK